MLGRVVFLGCQPCPTSQIFGSPYLRPNGLTQNEQIWYNNTYGTGPCFLGSATPISQGGGPQLLGPLACAHTVWETTTRFCMVIKLDARKFSQGRPRMLTRDLFAVANLLVCICYSQLYMSQRVLKRWLVPVLETRPIFSDQDQDQMYKTKTRCTRPRSRPRPKLQDQDQDHSYKTKTKTKTVASGRVLE